MHRFALTVGLVLATLPTVAPAALMIQIGPNQGSATPDAVVFPPRGEGFFDLVFTETGTPENEGLFAYDLLIVSSTPGARLVRAEKPDNWVFTAPDATFVQAQATSSQILVNAINSLELNSLSDITTGSKAARVYFEMDPGTPFGAYPFRLDPVVTIFASGDPSREILIPVDVSDLGVIVYVPEPSGLAFLGAAALLALRRRRR